MARIKIKDIAEKAGVSKTTVSFAFNKPERLPEARVRQIMQIAEEMGYTPEPVARTLSTGITGTIGVLVPQPIPEIFSNPFMPEFLEGVGEICTEASLSLMIVPPLKGSMQRAIVNAAVDGFLTLGLEESKATMKVLPQRGVPYVTVDSDPIEGVPAVNVDDENGARAVMQHVLQAGHRQISILSIRSGKFGHYQEYAGTLRHRVDGYLAALKRYGLGIDGRHVHLIEFPSTEDGGRAGFEVAWKGRHHPSAIVAMSDIMAIGVIKAAQSAGIAVPRELSVVGYDDLPLASLVHPPLTTVAQPLVEKGRLAGELLLKYIRGQLDATHHMLPTRLIVRESVANLNRP
jgi:DNA-binding LacI/PurR family transcriptional regulator